MTKPHLPPPKECCTITPPYYIVSSLDRIFFAAVLTCVASFGNCLAEETIYKYVDDQNGLIYSDTPPTDSARNVKIINPQSDLNKPSKVDQSNTNSRLNTKQPSPKNQPRVAATTSYPLWQVGLFLTLLIIPATFLQFYMLPRLRGNSFQQATTGVLDKNHIPALHNLKLTLESGEQTILPHLIHDHSGVICLHNKPHADAAAIIKAIEKLSDGVPVNYMLLVEDKVGVDCKSKIRMSTLSGLQEALRALPVARYTPDRIEAVFKRIQEAKG